MSKSNNTVDKSEKEFNRKGSFFDEFDTFDEFDDIPIGNVNLWYLANENEACYADSGGSFVC